MCEEGQVSNENGERGREKERGREIDRQMGNVERI